MGYIGEPQATRDVITEDGWFKSGDIGYINHVSGWGWVCGYYIDECRKVFYISLEDLKVIHNYKHFNSSLLLSSLLLEIIVTATGENVAPVPIESAIKEQLPIISNAVLVGDQKSFLSCLLTFKVRKETTVT